MELIARKARELEPYTPITGNFPIRLDANESWFNPNEQMHGEIAKAISELPLNRYPDPYCDKLRDIFAAHYGVSADCVTAANGSDELLALITGCLLSTGDTIITLSPDFSMYRFYGELYELNPAVLPKREDLSINIDALIACANEQQAKAILFSNPCNPTGLGLPMKEIEKLVKGVECLVIVDEAYMEFYDQSVLPLTQKYPNLMVLKTCSKAIGLAGIRLGFAVANRDVTKALWAVKSPYNVNSMSQAVGQIVLQHTDYLASCREQIIASRDVLFKALKEMENPNGMLQKVHPTAANFIFVATSKAEEIYTSLLQYGIAVRKMGDNLRITAGSPPENSALLLALEQIMAKEKES